MNNTVVLIPHYNNFDGLLLSLSSIDTSENVDIIIVDDGSKREIIDESLANSSFRANGVLNYMYLKENQGIEFALNKGLDFILLNKHYKYVARLDCGDICLGKRFFIQSEFLENNLEIKLVGSNAKAVDTKGTFLYNMNRPESTKMIRKKMYLNSMFIHPCVMFRTEMIHLVGKYPTHYKSAEDYAYFFKFVKNYETANINQYLVQIEINPEGISLTRRKEQVKNRIKIIWENFYFGYYPVYGLLRSVILYIVPKNVLLYFKKKLLHG